MPLQAMVRQSRPLELVAVPQVLRVPELLHVRAEVFQKVVARAGGDAGHGGVGKARNAVCHLADGAVAAAGVKADGFTRLRQLPGHVRGTAGAVRQHAGAVQTVLVPQPVRHLIDAGPLVLFSRAGVDDENVLHGADSPFISLQFV